MHHGNIHAALASDSAYRALRRLLYNAYKAQMLLLLATPTEHHCPCFSQHLQGSNNLVSRNASRALWPMRVKQLAGLQRRCASRCLQGPCTLASHNAFACLPAWCGPYFTGEDERHLVGSVALVRRSNTAFESMV